MFKRSSISRLDGNCSIDSKAAVPSCLGLILYPFFRSLSKRDHEFDNAEMNGAMSRKLTKLSSLQSASN